MEKTRIPMSKEDIEGYLTKLQSFKNYDPELIELVRSDLAFGITKEEIEEYTAYKKKYKINQQKIYSKCLRSDMAPEIKVLICGKGRTEAQMEELFKLYEEGFSYEDMKKIFEQSEGMTNRMEKVAKEYRKRIQDVTKQLESAIAEDEPLKESDVTYAKDIINLITEAANQIAEQDKHFEGIVKTIVKIQQTKEQEEKNTGNVPENKEDEGSSEQSNSALNAEIDKLNEAHAEQIKIINDQQNLIDEANAAVIRLRNEKDRLVKENEKLKGLKTEHLDTIDDLQRKVKNLENDLEDANDRIRRLKEEKNDMRDSNNESGNTIEKPDVQMETKESTPSVSGILPQEAQTVGYGIPVYYPVNIVNQGQVVEQTMMEVSRRKSNGVAGFLSRLGFKQRSRADIVKMVAAGRLVPAQLVQIKVAIEKGLTEGQLVELINNDLDPEKMKEIIEIAVLENQLP